MIKHNSQLYENWKERLYPSIGLFLTTLFFLLLLLFIWVTNVTHTNLLSGFIPITDSNIYYWDARKMLEGGNFSVFSSGRPLFPSFLTSLLAITQQNLQISLLILTIIVAISCFSGALEVFANYGFIPSFLFLVILITYFFPFLGTTMTENLGMSLGLLAFSLICRGANSRKIVLVSTGLLILTLSLCARAGAFFILGLILLWGIKSFSSTSKVSWKFLLQSSAAVLLGFLLNSILIKVAATPGHSSFSNFAYVFYGLIEGGDWRQAIIDYPYLSSLPVSEATQKIYSLAFDALKENPFKLLLGMIRAWKVFLFENYVFSFVDNLSLNVVLQILSVLGIYFSLRNFQSLFYSLIIFSTVGILLSVPFLPPWDTVEMRAYASTMPFTCILPVIGFAHIAHYSNSYLNIRLPKFPIASGSFRKFPKLLFTFSLLFVFLCIVPPIVIKNAVHRPQFPDVVCPNEMEKLYIRTSSGSSLDIFADNDPTNIYIGVSSASPVGVHVSQFKEDLGSGGYPDLAKEATLDVETSHPVTFWHTFDLREWGSIWLVSPSDIMPKSFGIAAACGHKVVTSGDVVKSNVFHVKSIIKLREKS